MMVKVSMRKICKSLYIHGLLDHRELQLERAVGLRLHEGENLVTSVLINRNLLHSEHLWVNAWPILLRDAEHLSLR